LFFFFASRRRHTRSKRDWSSDVCSSDLRGSAPPCAAVLLEGGPLALAVAELDQRVRHPDGLPAVAVAAPHGGADPRLVARADDQIGRASCRERACVAAEERVAECGSALG